MDTDIMRKRSKKTPWMILATVLIVFLVLSFAPTETRATSSSTNTSTKISIQASIDVIARFFYDVTNFQVEFSDLSTGDPTAWHWEFGDGQVSNSQNPIHIYMREGYYNVSLTVSNGVDVDYYNQIIFVGRGAWIWFPIFAFMLGCLIFVLVKILSKVSEGVEEI